MVDFPIEKRNAEPGSLRQEQMIYDALDGTPFQTDDIVNGLLIIESGIVSLLERVTLAATVMGSNLAHDKVAINDNAPSYDIIPQQLSLISKQVCDSTFDSLNKKNAHGNTKIDYRGAGCYPNRLFEILTQPQFNHRLKHFKFKKNWQIIVDRVNQANKFYPLGVSLPNVETMCDYLRKFRELFSWYLKTDLFTHQGNTRTARAITAINQSPKFYLCELIDYRLIYRRLELFSIKLFGTTPLRDISNLSTNAFHSFICEKFAETIGERSDLEVPDDAVENDIVTYVVMNLGTKTSLTAEAAKTNIPATQTVIPRVLILSMGDFLSNDGKKRLYNFTHKNNVEVKNVYTITSSADDDHSSHGLEKHVPIDWASIYVLPHLVRIVSNSSYKFQFDEIYLDHLVPTKINMYSVPNVGEFFSQLLLHLQTMKMLSSMLRIILPFHATVLYELHQCWPQMNHLLLRTQWSRKQLGIPFAGEQLPARWKDYIIYGAITSDQFVQGLNSKFSEAQRTDNNFCWQECHLWIQEAKRKPTNKIVPLKFVVLHRIAALPESKMTRPFKKKDINQNDVNEPTTNVSNNNVDHPPASSELPSAVEKTQTETVDGEKRTTVSKDGVDPKPASNELPSAVEKTQPEPVVDKGLDGCDFDEDVDDLPDISATLAGTGVDAKKSPPIVETFTSEEEQKRMRRSGRRSLRLKKISPELPSTVPKQLQNYNQPSTCKSTRQVPLTPAAGESDTIYQSFQDPFDKNETEESRPPNPRKNLFETAPRSAFSATNGGKSDQLCSSAVSPPTEAKNESDFQQSPKTIRPSVSSNTIDDRNKPPKSWGKTMLFRQISFNCTKAEFERKRRSLSKDIGIVIKFTDTDWISCLKVKGPSPYVINTHKTSVMVNPTRLISPSPGMSKKRDRSALEPATSQIMKTSPLT